MALLKYTGDSETVVVLDGQRVTVRPNRMFSGPKELANEPEFELLGATANEDRKISRKGRSLKFEVAPPFNANVNLELLNKEGMPKVSICIVTKDGNNIIQKCINSIGDNVEYDNIEILVCDTGTTDPEVKNFYGFMTQDPRVQLFEGHKYNFSKNNNFLAKQATGDLLLFLNNDVFMTYDAVSEMVRYAMISNLGCIGHRMVWDEHRELIQHDGQTLYNELGRWTGLGHHNYRQHLNNVSNIDAIVEGATAACMMMRKDLFDQVGGFDEEYLDILQDVDLNLKVYMAGYENFCIRKKHIIHVDHGSRKTDNTPESINDYKKLQRDWQTKPFPVREKPDASFIVCATNKEQMRTMVDSLNVKTPHEIVFTNNTKNIMTSSEALNRMINATHGEYIFCIHQDVTFEQKEIIEAVKTAYIKLGVDTGIIGPAGALSSGNDIKKSTGIDYGRNRSREDEYMSVQCIDEYCLIMKRSHNLRFGEYLDHYHFYGADLCCLSMSNNLKNYAYNFDITHHSGGDGNLKSEYGYTNYIIQARKFYTHWGAKFPQISTTTAHFLNNRVYYFLAHMLGLEPYEEEIDTMQIPSSDLDFIIKMDNTPNSLEYLMRGASGTSIVIPNKGNIASLSRCIAQMSGYATGDFEIIVADRGTTDLDTLEYYKTIKDAVKIVDASEPNFSKAMNNVIENHLTFNRLMFINSNANPTEDVISKMNKAWTKEVGVVGMPIKDKESKYEMVSVDCMMMPTELFEEMGGFDESYLEHFQGEDLCLKIKERGYDISICPEVEPLEVNDDAISNIGDSETLDNRWGNLN